MNIIQKQIIPKEEFTNITEDIKKEINNCKITNGIVVIYSKHTTVCIGILEDEKLLKIDEKDFFERLAPSSCLYRHDNLEERSVPKNERRNGYSHLRAMLLNPQTILPIINGELDLGKWQKIFYIECDLGKEDRTYNILIMEEK